MTPNCRICGSSELRPYLHVRDYRLQRCQGCGFVQVEHKPDAGVLSAIYSDAYFTHAKYRDHRARDLENRRRLSLLRQALPSQADVLDAGCSTGDFIAAANSSYRMYGLDLSESAIAIARTANPGIAERLVSGRLEDSTHGDRRFDAVCLWDVIEHLWDPAAVVTALLGRLRPDGYLFISTPAIDAPVARLTGRYWAFMTPPEHLGFFTRRSFEALFQEPMPARIQHSFRSGKWANLAFIGYKIARIAPDWFPSWLLAPLQWPLVRRLNLYVPTGDVRYLVVRKLPPIAGTD